jgi:hypothetical protein
MDLTGHSPKEMARHALRLAAQPTGTNLLAMVGRALTTSGFSLILANVANKSLTAGWGAAEESSQQWCVVGWESDFKTHRDDHSRLCCHLQN